MPTVHDSVQAEIFEVETSLDTFGHKCRRVLAFYRAELQRAFDDTPGTAELHERIGIHRLMALRLLSQLLDKRAGQPVSEDDKHLVQLLFSAERQFAESTAELQMEYGLLDFSGRLPELFAAEFHIDANDAYKDACHIRASRAYAEHNREQILADAKAAGLVAA